MIPALKAEFRKLLTIRSTYIISGVALLIAGGVSFYFIGVKADDITAPFSPISVQQSIFNLMAVVSILAGVVAILHICHEYRYNTIAYTLTMTNRRLKILLAKLIVIGLYAVVMTALVMLFVSVLAPLGVKMGNATVPPQDFAFWDVTWRTLAYMVGGAWLSLLFGVLFRSLVFTMVIFFMLPLTLEPILINLLKVDSNWLPNSALGHILGFGGGSPVMSAGMYSPIASAGVVALYLVIGWIAASVLFVRRDSN